MNNYDEDRQRGERMTYMLQTIRIRPHSGGMSHRRCKDKGLWPLEDEAHGKWADLLCYFLTTCVIALGS